MENCNSFRVQNQLWVFLRWISVWGSRKLEVIVGCEVDIEFLEWKPVDMCVIVARRICVWLPYSCDGNLRFGCFNLLPEEYEC